MAAVRVDARREPRLDFATQAAHLRPPIGRRIGFVSTRLAGTDGVSLEVRKWAKVLEAGGHACFYFAGECEHAPELSCTVAEAAFSHPDIDALGQMAFQPARGQGAVVALPGAELRPAVVSRRIREISAHLKTQLYAYARTYALELLIVENALSIPMNLALGVALTEFIAETGLPTIAHHHDFYWERKRFEGSCVADYLDMAFPPRLPSVRHVVINSLAAQQLSWRKGLSSVLIPNVMDFAQPPPPADAYAGRLREALGLGPDELLILQPTRVVQRKGIEHAVELTRRLERPACLVISHASGDEGADYARRIDEYAALLGVRVCFVDGVIAAERGFDASGRPLFRLDDIYSQADLVTYPSLEEGFGNALLEAVYHRRPLLVNNYAVFNVDIKPKGLRVIAMEDFITADTVQQVQAVLGDPALAAEMAETNYALAQRYFSYAVLERRLELLLADLFGED